jgi:hypothetical protein
MADERVNSIEEGAGIVKNYFVVIRKKKKHRGEFLKGKGSAHYKCGIHVGDSDHKITITSGKKNKIRSSITAEEEVCNQHRERNDRQTKSSIILPYVSFVLLSPIVLVVCY